MLSQGLALLIEELVAENAFRNLLGSYESVLDLLGSIGPTPYRVSTSTSLESAVVVVVVVVVVSRGSFNFWTSSCPCWVTAPAEA